MEEAKAKTLCFTVEEAESRYMGESQEVYPDIFLFNRVKGLPGEKKVAHLGIAEKIVVIRIRIDGNTAGFLVLDNMAGGIDLQEKSLALLHGLKDHIVSAFIKSKLLLELQDEREAAIAVGRSKGEFLAGKSLLKSIPSKP